MSMWLNVLIAVTLVVSPLRLVADGPPGLEPVVYLPLVMRNTWSQPPPLLIAALYYDTYLADEPDEAFQLFNPTGVPAPLDGWQLSSAGRTVTFPAGMMLAAHARLWCARSAQYFRLSFGDQPGCEYGGDSDPAVPDLTGSAPRFGNSGGRVVLTSPEASYADVLVYEGGDTTAPGWQGPSVYPYQPIQSFGAEGQVLYRKLDQGSGLPVADTDTRADWAQDPADAIDGRKVQHPGWALDRFFLPQVVTERATVAAFVSPDHAFAALKALLEATRSSMRFEGYTFENARLGEVVAARARGGVRVEMLLEGGPPGGVSLQQRWIVAQIAAAGGQVYYLRADASQDIHSRYAYQHGKFWVLDGATALVSSENISPEAYPDDDPGDGTLGRRGVTLVTDAASVVARLSAIMDADIAPATQRDVWAWDATDASLGAPPSDFSPSYESGGTFYPIQAPQPLITEGEFTFQVIQAPEGALRTQDSLLGLLNRAGAGDTVLVEQLYEQTYFGSTNSSVTADPNPRLEAYIAAARRGATVRVLLDAFFDDLASPRSNLRTVEYLSYIAQAEGLDLQARRGNPTGLGIHNKLVLAQIGGQGWAVAGSLNGGEVSAKLNREVALLVGSDAAYDYLARVFWYDWGVTP